MIDPTRLFVTSGVISRATLRWFWVVFATRVAIELQLTPIQLILLGTSMELTILVSEIPTGVVADVISRRLSVIISFFVMGGSIVMAGLVDTFPLLVVSQMLWGLGHTFRSGAETAWITDELGGAHMVETLLLRRARIQFAFAILGILVGAGLAAATTLPTAIIAAGSIQIAWGLFLIFVMPEHAFERQRGDTWGQFVRTLQAGAKVVGRTPVLRVLVATMVFAAFAGETMDRLDIRRLDQIGLPNNIDDIVIIGVIATLESVLGFLFVWRVERRVTGHRVPAATALVLAGAVVGGLMMGFIAILPIAALGLLIQGGLRSTLEPLYTTWANAHTPAATRATVHSFVGQADAGGEILGGLALGWVATSSTVPTAMGVSVALFAVAAITASYGRRAWSKL